MPTQAKIVEFLLKVREKAIKGPRKFDPAYPDMKFICANEIEENKQELKRQQDVFKKAQEELKSDPTVKMSTKAKKAAKIIRENDFGCAKKSVAKIASLLIGEKVDICNSREEPGVMPNWDPTEDLDIDMDDLPKPNFKHSKYLVLESLICDDELEDEELYIVMGIDNDDHDEEIGWMNGNCYTDDTSLEFTSLRNGRIASPAAIKRFVKNFVASDKDFVDDTFAFLDFI